jgi:hypothetical protein
MNVLKKNNVIVCLLFSLLLYGEALAAEVRADEGKLDLRPWDFALGAVALSGGWDFYMSRLIEPSHFYNGSVYTLDRDFVDFPATWNSLAGERSEGFATYHLKVILASHGSAMALALPHFYSSYKLWINGKAIAQNGKVAISESESKPQWLPQTVTFQPDSDTLDVVIHVSNFQHFKGGVREPIYLGLPITLKARQNLLVTSNLVLFIGLFAIALVFVSIYVFFLKELSLLFFAAVCFVWGIRSIFSNQYLFIQHYPDFSWMAMIRIEYVTLYLTMIFAMFYLGRLFREDVNFLFKYILIGGNVIFILVTLTFSSFLFTQLLSLYLSFCAVLIGYALFVVLRALVYERAGAWLIIASIILALVSFGYDLLSFEGLLPAMPLLQNGCYLIFFALNGISILYVKRYFGKGQKDNSVLSWDDLYKPDRDKK